MEAVCFAVFSLFSWTGRATAGERLIFPKLAWHQNKETPDTHFQGSNIRQVIKFGENARIMF